MKTIKRLGSIPAAGAVAMSLLLGASVVQAAVVTAPGDSSRAIEVTNVNVDGTLYNVTFPGPTEAFNVYGTLGQEDLPFTDESTASAAIGAINDQLNNAASEILYVGGTSLSDVQRFFHIVFETEGFGTTARGSFVRSAGPDTIGNDFWINTGTDVLFYNTDERVFADFTVVPVPAAVWLFGSALLGLVGVARRRKQATA